MGGMFAPEADQEICYNPKKCWRRIQELNRHFWHSKSIPSLSTSKKWLHERKNLQVNDVLLVSPDSCRAHWLLDHVIEVYHGKDGWVRLVKL